MLQIMYSVTKYFIGALEEPVIKITQNHRFPDLAPIRLAQLMR